MLRLINPLEWIILDCLVYQQLTHSYFVNIIRSQYSLNLNVLEGHEGYTDVLQYEQPIGYQALRQQELVLGSSSSSGRPTLTVAQQTSLAAKKKSKAMAIAARPGQAILMNAFMMYMSGSQLNIFSISITSGAILSPLANIFGVQKQFGGSDVGADLAIPKLLFVCLNLVWLGIGLYKMSSMRLLPTTSADYTYKIVWKEMLEATSIPPGSMIL
jgi:ER membrane protein complex subunit 4